MYYDQHDFNIRCEWGMRGLTTLAPICDVVVIVDVLSFTTSVDIATGRGAIVYPYSGPSGELNTFAASVGADVAGFRRSGSRYSLSPSSLLKIPVGTSIVLPSPNGSTLTLAAPAMPVLAGCLRNARATAAAAAANGSHIAVIPAGERWRDDGSLRPSFEDLLGAGAVISYLAGKRSPEAEVAAAVFRAAAGDLAGLLRQCSSGRELLERGYADDVELAAQQNVNTQAAALIDGAYRALVV